jgi:shikimate kinase
LTTASPEDEIRELLASRGEFYREVADHMVATDDASIDDVASRVLALWTTDRPDHAQ